MDLKQRLKHLRKQRGWSQEQVASLMGMDRGQYSRVENEKVEPNLSTLKKIATAFDIQLIDLFDENVDLDVNSKNKPLLDKLKLIEQLDEDIQTSLFKMIDVAISNKRLKDSLKNTLDLAS